MAPGDHKTGPGRNVHSGNQVIDPDLVQICKLFERSRGRDALSVFVMRISPADHAWHSSNVSLLIAMGDTQFPKSFWQSEQIGKMMECYKE